MIRVLHVIPSLQKAAGTSVYCMELCSQLVAEGESCAVAVKQLSSDDYQSPHVVPVCGVEPALQSLTAMPDVVHVHALWDFFLHRVVRWARKNRIPVLISPHGMLTPWALRQKWLKKSIALAVYQYRDLQSASMFHATATSEVADLRRLGLRQPVAIAPLGVDVPPLPVAVRHNSPRIALFISRVHKKKGLLNLVEAWAEIKKTKLASRASDSTAGASMGWQCMIAGPDQENHTAEVKARAQALGVADDFEFVGPVYGEQKNQLYQKADLFILPTFSENFGVVVIEALAYGCPVITTKAAPWGELLGTSDAQRASGKEEGRIRHNDARVCPEPRKGADACGWWIDVGVPPLAQALGEAMGLTDEERFKMGEAGRRLVERKYTWAAVSRAMLTSYRALVNKGCADLAGNGASALANDGTEA